MADYQLAENDVVIRTEDNACIPNDPANYDRVEYNEWLAAGGVPDPYVAPPTPPPVVNANLRIDAGIDAAITAAQNVRDGLHLIPSNLSAANFQQFLLQAKILSDAFVAMLQAQQTPPAE